MKKNKGGLECVCTHSSPGTDGVQTQSVPRGGSDEVFKLLTLPPPLNT